MNDFDVNNAIPFYQKAMAINASPTVVRNLSMCYFYRGYYKKSIETEYILTTDSFNHQDMKLMYNYYNNLIADSAHY